MCMHIYIYIYLHICIYIYICIYILETYINIHTWKCSSWQRPKEAWRWALLVATYIYIHTYTHIHTYTYIHNTYIEILTTEPEQHHCGSPQLPTKGDAQKCGSWQRLEEEGGWDLERAHSWSQVIRQLLVACVCHVVSHVFMSRVTRVNASCHTYEWALVVAHSWRGMIRLLCVACACHAVSRAFMSCVARVNASCHTYGNLLMAHD